MRTTTFILLLTIYAPTAYSQRINWSDDLDYLKKKLPKKHKNLFFNLSQDEFNNAIEILKRQSPDLSDISIAIKLQQIIVKIGDSHTNVNYDELAEDNNTVPFRTYLFDDGLYILWANEKYSDLLGQKLISINGYSVNQLFDSLRTMVVNDNEAIVKEYIPKRILTERHILKHFQFLTDSVDFIEHEGVDGLMGRTKFHSDDRLIKVKFFNADNLPIGWSNRQSFFWEKYLPDSKIYYIQYNKCWSKELEYRFGNKKTAEKLPSFTEFQAGVIDFIKRNGDIKLVFDMRFNGGGDSKQGQYLIEKIKGESINQDEKIFVLIGRNTFSSAIINTIQFKKMTRAITVGEETAGKTQSYGEVKEIKLPSSKLTIEYSTKYFKLTDTYLKTITPDIKIPVTFSDYKMGVDSFVKYVKDYQSNAR